MDRNRVSPLLPSPPSTAPTPQELAVLAAIRETAFGAVEVVLHQSRIVQIVRTEKLRVDEAPPRP